jgi:hypothetical protein
MRSPAGTGVAVERLTAALAAGAVPIDRISVVTGTCARPEVARHALHRVVLAGAAEIVDGDLCPTFVSETGPKAD